MSSLIISIIGAVTAMAAGSGYIWSIIKGSTRPHKVTWAGWSLAGVLGLWASLDGGAKVGLLVSAVLVVLAVATFALSLIPKYGKPGGQKSDYIAGGVAAAALIAWRIYHFSPAVAATIAIAADMVFLWFTVRDTWNHPKTEELWPWLLGAVGEVLGIAELGKFNYAAAAYPVYVLLGGLAIVAVLLVRAPNRVK